jgi:hypothetical protein
VGRAYIAISVEFDGDWYLSVYSDAQQAVSAGIYSSAIEHFTEIGIRKGYLPSDPIVDEVWYLDQYPDVAQACTEGQVSSPKSHFIQSGFREGRYPLPPENQFKDPLIAAVRGGISGIRYRGYSHTGRLVSAGGRLNSSVVREARLSMKTTVSFDGNTRNASKLKDDRRFG